MGRQRLLSATIASGVTASPPQTTRIETCRTTVSSFASLVAGITNQAVTQRWLSHLRQYFPTLPFKATTQNKRDVSSSAHSSQVGKLGAYGAEAATGESASQPAASARTNGRARARSRG